MNNNAKEPSDPRILDHPPLSPSRQLENIELLLGRASEVVMFLDGSTGDSGSQRLPDLSIVSSPLELQLEMVP